jgi:hypothetical protein
MGRVRITRPFVLLALAALLAPRIEASRTSVSEPTRPASLAATRADATGLLASLAPSVRLDQGAAATAETTKAPLFDLGDVVLVESALESEDRFGIGPVDLLGPTPLRGPPPSYPETRVGGFELLPPFRVGASARLSLWSRQACGFPCLGVVSDSRYDPWGLQVLPEGSENDPFIARAVLEANKETRSTEELRKENDALLNFASLINKPVAVARAAYNVAQDARNGRFTIGTALDSLFLAMQVRGTRPLTRVAERESRAVTQAVEGESATSRSAALTPGSPEHKAARWRGYEDRGGNWPQERWSKQYDTNMKNPVAALEREVQYRTALGGKRTVLETPYGDRQIDIFRPDYAGELKTGYEYLTKANALAIQKDLYLKNTMRLDVEWILEGGGSKPLLEALQKAGIKVHVGPKI